MEASDIQKRLSGGASNNDPNLSLGGKMSSTSIVNNALQNLFDNVSSAERASGVTDYRCFYLMNAHSTESLEDAVIFISAQTPSEDTDIEIGLDPAGVGDGDTTGVATDIPDETYPPDGVAFSAPANAGTGLSIGTMGPGDAVAVWVKRTVEPGAAAASNDPFTLRVIGTPVE